MSAEPTLAVTPELHRRYPPAAYIGAMFPFRSCPPGRLTGAVPVCQAVLAAPAVLRRCYGAAYLGIPRRSLEARGAHCVRKNVGGYRPRRISSRRMGMASTSANRLSAETGFSEEMAVWPSLPTRKT